MIRSVAVSLSFLLFCSSFPARSQSWPHFAGPDRNFTAEPTTELAADRPLGLQVSWKVELGSGYSQIVVDGGEAFAMYSDSTHDVLASLDASSGERNWTYLMGPTFKGRQGSMDGPLSTPSLSPEHAIGLSAAGLLFCVERATGAELWQRDLVAADGAVMPEYGFATSPLLVDDLVVISVEIPGTASTAAFDAGTGDRVWTSGSRAAPYQSPTPMTAAGRRQLLTLDGPSVRALDVATGEAEWEYDLADHPGVARRAHLVPLGDDQLLVRGWGAAILLSITDLEGGVEVKEVWRSQHLKGSYAIPVRRNGRFFGYSGNSYLPSTTPRASACGDRGHPAKARAWRWVTSSWSGMLRDD